MQNIPKCQHCSRNFCAKETGKQGNQYSRVPLLLTCGHTFCTECLSKLARQQKSSITCPNVTCQQVTSLGQDGSVRSLTPDIYIMGLLAAFNSCPPPLHMQLAEFLKPSVIQSKKQKPKEDMCEECTRVPATCRCERCEGNMCGSCFTRVHSASKMLRQHQATPLDSHDSSADGESTASSGVSSWPQFCTSHPSKPIEYYCEQDRVSICSHCAVMGDHQGHQLSSCEDKKKLALTELNGMITSATAALRYSKKSYQLLHGSVPAGRAAGRSLIENIQLRFQRLHSVLQAREQILCEEVLKTTQQQLAPLEEMQANLSDHMKNLETSLSEARSVVANGRVSSAGRCLHRLIQLTAAPCHAVQSDRHNLIRCITHDDMLIEEFRRLGNIDGYITAPVELRCPEDLGAEIPTALLAELSAPSPQQSAVGIATFMLDSVLDTMLPRSDSTSPSSIQTSKRSRFQCNSTDFETASISSIDSNSTTHSGSVSHRGGARPRLLPTLQPGGRFTLPPRRPQLLRTTSQTNKAKQYRTEPAYVTHIRNPQHFFVQMNRDIDKIKILSRDINAYCNSVASLREIPSSIEPDDLVLAQFSQDKMWYRARVLKMIDGEYPSQPTLEVLYVDYGNSECVPLESCRNIQPRFLKEPEMAWLCSLVDILPADSTESKAGTWSNEAITTFASMSGNKAMLLTIIHETEMLTYVDLSRPASADIEDDGPISVRDVLLFLGFANFVSPHTLPASTIRASRRRFLSQDAPMPNKLDDVRICHMESPDDFYVQLGSDAHYLIELMANLQSTYNTDQGDAYTLYYAAKGMMCVALFSVDQQWYRAEIVDVVDANSIVVKYVDYGNVENVSIHRLKKILDVYTILPIQALRCSLADVACGDDGWPADVAQYMAQLMATEVELVMNVKSVTANRTLSVFLQEPSEKHSVNSTFVARGWAKAIGVGWELPPRHEKTRSVSTSSASNLNFPNNVGTYSSAPMPSVAAPKSVTSGMHEKSDAAGIVVHGRPFYPEVSVTCVVTPSQLYVLEQSRENSLVGMMTELQDAMRDSSVDPDIYWESGMDCVVRLKVDFRWHRAVVLEPSAEKFKVALVDEGTVETVAETEMRAIPNVFATSASFALCCHLSDIVPAGDISKWSRTACESLTSLLNGISCCFLVPKGDPVNGSLPVDLLLEEVIAGGALTPDTYQYNSVAQHLRDKGLALPKRPSTKFEIPKCRLLCEGRHVPACTLAFGASTAVSMTAPKPVPPVVPVDAAPSSLVTSNSAGSSVPSTPRTQMAPCSVKMAPPPAKPMLDMSAAISPPSIAEILSEPIPPPSISGYPAATNVEAVCFPPAEQPSDELILAVTYVDSNCLIYGHALKDDLGPLQELMVNYQRVYADTQADATRRWVPGEIAAAQFTEDNQFYRAKVIGVNNVDDTVEVLYVDFGNTEVVSPLRLRANPIHTDVPQQAHCCRLDRITWVSDDRRCPAAVIDIIRSVIINQRCTASIKGFTIAEDGTLINHVELVLQGGQNLNQLVIEDGHAILDLMMTDDIDPTSVTFDPTQNIDPNNSSLSVHLTVDGVREREGDTAAEEQTGGTPLPDGVPRLSRKRSVDSPYKSLCLPDDGAMTIVTVTDVDQPNLVYVQHVKLPSSSELESNRQLDQLVEFSEFYSSSWQELQTVPVDFIAPGMACLAQCSVDECWYRAEVIDVHRYDAETFEATICFVDYGSADYICSNQKMRVLPPDHMDLPAQAILCRIAGLEPVDKELGWNPQDVTLIAELLTNRILCAVIRGVAADGITEVDLYGQDEYMRIGVTAPLLYQTLVNNGFLRLADGTASDVADSETKFSDQLHRDEVEEFHDDDGSTVAVAVTTATSLSWEERVKIEHGDVEQ